MSALVHPVENHLTATAALSVRNLVKHYPKAKVNAVDGRHIRGEKGRDFRTARSEWRGKKTTTIGILTTAILPTEGTASIMDIRCRRRSNRHQAADCRGAAAKATWDRSLRVREILTFHAAYHGVAKKEREALADRLLDELGLGERKNEKVNKYSGGMAQRLMIARALMHEPDVLFLDEPTNNFRSAVAPVSLGQDPRDERARPDYLAHHA